jgi:hypothetical protein
MTFSVPSAFSVVSDIYLFLFSTCYPGGRALVDIVLHVLQ